MISKADSTGTTTYGYDYENRLIKITYPDSSISAYSYDGVGKRIQTVVGGITTRYLYDRLNAIIERDQSNNTIATYIRGLSYGGGIGGIVSRTTPQAAHFYHYDRIGTVTSLTNDEGGVEQRYIYDAYGNLLSVSGDVTNPYRFSTKEFSHQSGLIYFGARYYDPSVGRFITKDPWTWRPNDQRLFTHRIGLDKVLRDKIFLQKGVVELKILLGYAVANESLKSTILNQGAENPFKLHNYVYAQNNPINLIDPYGLGPDFWDWWDWIWTRFLWRLITPPFMPDIPGYGQEGPGSTDPIWDPTDDLVT